MQHLYYRMDLILPVNVRLLWQFLPLQLILFTESLFIERWRSYARESFSRASLPCIFLESSLRFAPEEP
jgi:hypothetical protein